MEERTFQFAKDVRLFVKTLPPTIAYVEDSRQLVKASGSVGANYREANDALGKKDFLNRLRIARKEAKETIHWLECIDTANTQISDRMTELKQEAKELKNILSAIISNTEKKNKKV